MACIHCIVEGHGEVAALPPLLRRLVSFLGVDREIEFARPWRVHADKVFKGDWSEVGRAIEGARRSSATGVVLVLDTDCEMPKCPRNRAAPMLSSLRELAGSLPAALVLAECEFESWFLESAESLRGRRGLPKNLARPAEPLTIRGAKEWLGDQMPRGYSERLDQPALAGAMDIEAARRHSRSFRKLCDEVLRLCQ